MARPACGTGLQVPTSTCLMLLLAAVAWSCWSTMQLAGATPAAAVEQCSESGCTLDNAYDVWNDRSPCKAASVVYPRNEAEVLNAVADAVRTNRKIKVSTRYGHSIPKLACPGTSSGVIISSKMYNSIVSIDTENATVTAQGGITMRQLIDQIASKSLALTVAPSFDGVTLAGLLANGVHGSSLFGKGGAIHEYVIGMTIVTPASAAEGYSKLRILGSDDPDLNAAKVNLGVLGFVSTVTLQLEPMFKRQATMRVLHENDTGELVDEVNRISKSEEYGEIMWYPSLREVVYKYDHRVPVTTPGEGKNNYYGLQSQLATTVMVARLTEEAAEAVGGSKGRLMKCELALSTVTAQQTVAYGYQKNKNIDIPNIDIISVNITAVNVTKTFLNAFPVVGYQNDMATAGGCQRDLKPGFYCAWDQRVKGIVFFDAGIALPLRNLGPFLEDVRKLRDAAPAHSLCDMDIYTGFLFRFVKKTDTYLGTAQEDTVAVDFAWSRGNDGMTPRLDMDVFQELEQIAIDKYGARPHWGKNRNCAFEGVWKKYPKLLQFLDTKNRFDPSGFFSSEWSDAVLGLNGQGAPGVSTDAPFCAIEGNCNCVIDEHCAPQMNSFCRPGRVFTEARVCRSR
ncbi:L-gulonolactone oxidase 3 [Physcomitrium patens]|uniref:L-gulonolactone oxidase n=2 Tax=Physcomitrium patens TaxID=3218 RepID=A0A2K1KXQ7_PHYPA|nr:L-gulonolactone oxidase 3-like [Physcomitrium patens]PNR58536.1 hypothetical protein PHYPA_005531 [Physcomitrium patens]|eukprot:XP_024371569.1 L-gulonolactone oxidase 3-like [Physcomitrella patens]